MGNRTSCTQVVPMVPGSGVKILHPDGKMEEIRGPVSAGKIMLQNPQHLVWRWNAVTKKHQSLPADATLEMGRLYFLLPEGACVGGLFRASPKPICAPVVQVKTKTAKLKRSRSYPGSRSRGSRLLHAFLVRHRGSVTKVTVSSDCVVGTTLSEASSSSPTERASQNLTFHTRLVSRTESWKPRLATIEESAT